jgi:hypothetical protein
MESINFEHLKLQYEDIKQDLGEIVSKFSDCKVGDFGCEWGYTTLSLMIALHTTECIGIDFRSSWRLPNFDDAKRLYSDKTPGDELEEIVQNLLEEKRWPEFKHGDVLKSSTLPSNLDLAYCKLLLNNIYGGYYNNSPNGIVGLRLATTNIVKCVKPDGLICFIDKLKYNEAYSEFLRQNHLTSLHVFPIHRNDILYPSRRNTLTKSEYWVYYARKNGD